MSGVLFFYNSTAGIEVYWVALGSVAFPGLCCIFTLSGTLSLLCAQGEHVATGHTALLWVPTAIGCDERALAMLYIEQER